ncbi:MAG: hypothetical protein AAFQ88_12370, partial [Pseudomonadota bacterium]
MTKARLHAGQHARTQRRPGLIAHCAGGCRRLLRLAASVVFAACLVVVLFVAVLHRGPIALPSLHTVMEAQFAAVSDTIALRVGGTALSLDKQTGWPVVQARRVRVVNAVDGSTLLSAPVLNIRLSMRALLGGEIEPVSIALLNPSARVVRTESGLFRLDLGAAGPPSDAAPTRDLDVAPQVAAEDDLANPTGFEIVSDVLDGLVGDGPLRPGTVWLERVEIRDADLIFRNAVTGNALRTSGGSLTLVREEGELVGDLRLPLVKSDGTRTVLTARGVRRRGDPSIALSAQFADFRLDRLAREITEIAWLAPFATSLSGSVEARVGGGGGLRDFVADLRAGQGTLALQDRAIPFDQLGARVAFDPLTDRLRLSHVDIASPTLEADFAGVVTLDRDADGGIAGLSAELSVAQSTVSLPERLAAPADIEGGSLSLRANLSPFRIDIADSHVTRGDLTVNAAGWIGLERPSADTEPVLTGSVRATAENATVVDLKALWPVGAGGNARAWALENLITGRIPALVAQVALGPSPDVSLDFVFEDVTSIAMPGMPPITGAAGEAQVRVDDMSLALRRGGVSPDGRREIDLAGSHMRITEFSGTLTPADIVIEGQGPIDAVLDLIDRAPLSLVSKLGLPLSDVGGTVTLTAGLRFPLIKALLVEEIDADVSADLRNVAMAVPLGEREPWSVSADRLALRASTTALSLQGGIRVAGAPMALAWRENYGGQTGDRTLTLAGRAPVATLRDLGFDLTALRAGSVDLDMTLTQQGSAAPRIALDTDLTDAVIEPAGLQWRKAQGISATAVLVLIPDERVTIEGLRYRGGGLSLAGSGVLSAGAVVELAMEEVIVDGLADLSVSARDRDGVLSVSLTGQLLDVSLLGDSSTGAGDTRVEAAVDIEQLVIVPELVLVPARGRLIVSEAEGVSAIFEGRVNGFAPMSGSLTLPNGTGPGDVTITSDDAGAFLRSTGLAEEAQGGRLTLRAALADGGMDRVTGTAIITDVQLTESSVLRRIVRRGDSEEQILRENTGLSFNRVEMPFVYDRGLITLDNV